MSKDLTKLVISKMLKERVGVSFLDSGGTPQYNDKGEYIGSKHGYGRHFERNQLRQFESELSVKLNFKYEYIDYTRNIYHFLTDNLYYDKNLTNSLNSFERYATNGQYIKRFNINKYSSWYEILDAWFKFKNYDVIYHDNTYNQENNLSQDFIFYGFNPDNTGTDIYDISHIALMIHNGADIRGGYTSPKIFEINEDTFWMIADGYIFCDNDHVWYTDDNYHWYSDNTDVNLDKIDFMELSEYIESPEHIKALESQILVPDNQLSMIADYHPKIINPVKYPLCILTDDSIGYCPICANELGILNPLKA